MTISQSPILEPEARPDVPEEPAILRASKGNPVPENHVAGFFAGHKGCRLRYAIFKSEAQIATGTVVLLPGRNESIEKYYETIRHLTARGLWVAIFDWRGQGGSERLLKKRRAGYVRRFSDYERDLTIFLETIVLPDTRLPFCLVAHSTGALVALSLAPQLTNRIERMVLASPFIAIGDIAVPRWVAATVARLFKLTGLGFVRVAADTPSRPFENNVLTSDRFRFERNENIFAEHPDLRTGPPTASWLAEVLTAMRRVTRFEHLHTVRVPTLVLAAGADRIVPLRDIEAFANRFRAGDVVVIDHARHELLQEDDRSREAALAAIDAFIPPDQSFP